MYQSRPSARRRSPPSSSSTEAVVAASGRDTRIAQPSSSYSPIKSSSHLPFPASPHHHHHQHPYPPTPDPSPYLNGGGGLFSYSTSTSPPPLTLPDASVSAKPAAAAASMTTTGGGGSGRLPKPSRAVREQARKVNHSMIEKRRREKINAALAELRHLVPASVDGNGGDEDDMDGGGGPSMSKAGAKEFKLEILVRTVSYLKILHTRVAALERDASSPRDGDEGDEHGDRPRTRRRKSALLTRADSSSPSVVSLSSVSSPSAYSGEAEREFSGSPAPPPPSSSCSRRTSTAPAGPPTLSSLASSTSLHQFIFPAFASPPLAAVQTPLPSQPQRLPSWTADHSPNPWASSASPSLPPSPRGVASSFSPVIPTQRLPGIDSFHRLSSGAVVPSPPPPSQSIAFSRSSTLRVEDDDGGAVERLQAASMLLSFSSPEIRASFGAGAGGQGQQGLGPIEGWSLDG